MKRERGNDRETGFGGSGEWDRGRRRDKRSKIGPEGGRSSSAPLEIGRVWTRTVRRRLLTSHRRYDDPISGLGTYTEDVEGPVSSLRGTGSGPTGWDHTKLKELVRCGKGSETCVRREGGLCGKRNGRSKNGSIKDE